MLYDVAVIVYVVAVIVYGAAVIMYGMAVIVYGMAVVVYDVAVIVYGMAVVVYDVAVVVYDVAVIVYGVAVIVYGVAVIVYGVPRMSPGLTTYHFREYPCHFVQNALKPCFGYLPLCRLESLFSPSFRAQCRFLARSREISPIRRQIYGEIERFPGHWASGPGSPFALGAMLPSLSRNDVLSELKFVEL